MKNTASCFILSLFLWGCTQMEQEDLSLSGEVRFKSVSFSSFSGNIPHARTEAESSWKHIFKEQAMLQVTDKNTGQTYEVIYNPNDFGDGFTLSLPYGSYTYFSEVAGGKFRRYLPFRIEGEFILNAESLDLTLNASTDYGLITIKNEYLKAVEIRHGNDPYGMGLLEDGSHYFIYVRKNLNPILEINETVENQLITHQFPVDDYNHYHFYFKLAQKPGNFIELALGAFELIEEGIESGEKAETGTFVDARDGQVYKTVQIGEQIWMAENLNYETAGSSCHSNPIICDLFGRSYSGEDLEILCPDGWHLPDNEEWQVLVDYLGGEEIAAEKLKSTTGWVSNPGTNESGFSALPTFDIGEGTDESAYWWSSSYRGDGNGYLFFMAYNYSRQSYVVGINSFSVQYYSAGCRCLKD